ncbi:hypothetical protein [Asticcacaulis sp.]|uniref:hypothetical protein n=1 Tax=Asticcacaulis sp. TaxID=1872648 RepID=UPI002B684F99|nr:hypothetical protein [Asticcacaulis sp.]HTM81848.1 hypothetical protein [Asticcacaulis sp.]
MANRKLIKDNFDLKHHDGSLAFVDKLKGEPTWQLNELGIFLVLNEPATNADNDPTGEIHEMIRLLKGSEWTCFEEQVLKPYSSHSTPAASLAVGGAEAQRQTVISGISPAITIKQSLAKQAEQFPDIVEFRTFGDKTLREGAFAWALGIIRNYGALLDERANAASHSERKILIWLWWGLLAIFLLSNLMDAGPLMARLHKHWADFPLFPQWSSIAIILLRGFAVFLTMILAGGICLLIRHYHFHAVNKFKKALTTFENITHQSSLHIGAVMKVRREKLDHLHDDLWAAAITFKEVHWGEGHKQEHATKYRLWTQTRSKCIRAAMWVNGRRKGLDDLLINLHNYILMGYAAQTARAEFKAHFTSTPWEPKEGRWKLFRQHSVVHLWGDWGRDKVIFIKYRAWSRLCRILWVLLAASVAAGFSIWLFVLRYRYDAAAISQSWFAELAWVLLGLKLAALAVPILYGVKQIYSLAARLEAPDEPKLIIENLKGAMPDERYTALQVLEKAVTELVEHDANRLLTEEDKHH